GDEAAQPRHQPERDEEGGSAEEQEHDRPPQPGRHPRSGASLDVRIVLTCPHGTQDRRLWVRPPPPGRMRLAAQSPEWDEDRAPPMGETAAMDTRDGLNDEERAELERLRQEVAALRVQARQPEAAAEGAEAAEAAGTGRARRQRWRTIVAVLLIVIGC